MMEAKILREENLTALLNHNKKNPLWYHQNKFLKPGAKRFWNE